MFRTQHPTRVEEDFRCVPVSSGVSLLRYTGSAAGDEFPSISVRPVAQHRPDICVIPAPGLPDPVLRAPGDYLIVRAERAGELDLRVRARRPGGSFDAQLALDRVALPLRRSRSNWGPNLRIVAHIAHRGDVVFDAGNWICGPGHPARIEGLEIRWPACPEDVSLTYSVRTGGHPTEVSREYGINEFAGTRGLSRPLAGLDFQLTGSGAESLELRAEALFERSPVTSAIGREVSLTGPTGHEALLGLRIAVAPASRPPNGPREARLATKIVHPRRRVHVFRNPDLARAPIGHSAPGS